MTLAVTEKQFQQQVIELAKLHSWLHYFTYRSTRSPSGFPDLVLVRDDRLVFAELKTDEGRMSPAQRQWYAALQRAANEIYVWRPRDWDAICEVLK